MNLNVGELIRNPIVFGALVGILLCILLFLNDRFFKKADEKKSGFLAYLKIFVAGFIVTTPLVFLLYNRNISFKSSSSAISGGSVPVMHDVVQDGGTIVGDDVSAESFKVKKSKAFKAVHADNPDW